MNNYTACGIPHPNPELSDLETRNFRVCQGRDTERNFYLKFVSPLVIHQQQGAEGVHLEVSTADHHLHPHFYPDIHLILGRDHQDIVQISMIQDPQY
jgi:hypothetical protein